jgi:heat shock protein HslJ
MSVRRLLMLPLCFGLAACSTSAVSAGDSGMRPPQAASPAAPVDATTLEGYHWKLQSATDSSGQRIGALFVRPDRPVQLDFAAGHITISQLCNAKGASYRVEQGHLIVGPMMSTQMACMPPALNGLDKAVTRRLASRPAVTVDREGAMPQLKLVTASGDVLQFTGRPTPEKRYGGPGETAFLEVAAQDVPCAAAAPSGTKCLDVRERHYDANGVATGEPGPWHPMSQPIEGYTHQPGVRNVLRVKRFDTTNGPAYVLDMVVESDSRRSP